MDQNELLRRLAAQAGGDAALERLSGALGTADGRRAVEQLSAQHADELEQAAKAAEIFQQAQPSAEVNVLSGGQPIYYYLISAQ